MPTQCSAATGDDWLNGFQGDDTLNGDGGNDLLTGGAGNDTLNGGSGDDDLQGEAGNDTLDGGSGDDLLRGGAGHDILTGGEGSDTFLFRSSEFTLPSDANDEILDFVSLDGEGADDLLDLSGIDANTTRSGDQPFLLSDRPAAHSVWWDIFPNADGSAEMVLYGDVDGNPFHIRVLKPISKSISTSRPANFTRTTSSGERDGLHPILARNQRPISESSACGCVAPSRLGSMSSRFPQREETMMSKSIGAAFAAALLLTSTSALAGEITGPPPSGNLDPAPPISHGNSFCSYSGLNDTPDGVPQTPFDVGDPGGQVQSFGYFMSHFDAFDPSDPAQRADDNFFFPANGCNGHNVPLHG